MAATLGTPGHCAHVLLHMIELCDVPRDRMADIKRHAANREEEKQRLQDAKRQHQTEFLTQLHALVQSGQTPQLDLTRSSP